MNNTVNVARPPFEINIFTSPATGQVHVLTFFFGSKEAAIEAVEGYKWATVHDDTHDLIFKNWETKTTYTPDDDEATQHNFNGFTVEKDWNEDRKEYTAPTYNAICDLCGSHVSPFSYDSVKEAEHAGMEHIEYICELGEEVA